ncbi:hypothetical protein BDN70DRAFT_935513 [Pholiota conissans]|uniref:Uncharacterized protein n=1 Tax=Pholiota conissans TaxID=109636 RepID=A0A9P5YWA9_9AGAR|nr:hypothetical protein BDN70DRAFT_935513 [Pholiota conissans]
MPGLHRSGWGWEHMGEEKRMLGNNFNKVTTPAAAAAMLLLWHRRRPLHHCRPPPFVPSRMTALRTSAPSRHQSPPPSRFAIAIAALPTVLLLHGTAALCSITIAIAIAIAIGVAAALPQTAHPHRRPILYTPIIASQRDPSHAL